MFRFSRLQDGKPARHETLRDVVGMSAAKETWLFVSPHDDDVVMGAALWVQAAVSEGVDVQVLIITDGRMGYCTLEQRDHIADVRLKETHESYGILGVAPARIAYVGYPDGGLATLQGRRHAQPGELHIESYIGLSNAFTYHLRRTRAARVFVPTSADLHPDHQVTNNEMMISIFHAAGAIWPELGKPLPAVPKVYELAVYCDFPQPPQLEVKSDEAEFEKKLAAIAAYRSQAQIAGLVEIIRQAGPYEYLREMNFRFYSPANYRGRFE